jgi:hypothetical protein
MVLQIGRGRHRPRPKLSSWAGLFDDGQEKPRPMGIKGRGRSGVSIPVNGNTLSQKPTKAVAVGNTLIYGSCSVQDWLRSKELQPPKMIARAFDRTGSPSEAALPLARH